MKPLAIAVVVGSIVARASACDLCALYSSYHAQGEVGSGFVAGVAEQFTHFGTLQFEGHEVPNPTGQYLNSAISQLYAGYNFNSRWGVQLNLPIIDRWYKRPAGFAIDQDTVAGPGDLSLTGNWVYYQKLTENYTFTGTLFGGVKFPTGNTQRLREEFNEIEVPGAPPSGIHGHDLTLGTGSYDGLVGTRLFARWKRGIVSADFQYAIRTEGAYDYRFANDILWSFGPGAYLLLKHNYTLALQALASGEAKGRDTFQGQKVDDTGMTSVYLGPQLTFTWSDKLSALLGADLPLSLQNTGLQAVPDYRVRAAISWHF